MRALAHIGVLKVLSRQKIPIDLIVGTSMGSAIGAREVTYDFERLMRAEGIDAKLLKCSEFGQALINHM